MEPNIDDIAEVALSCLAFDYRIQVERAGELAYSVGIRLDDCPYSDMDFVDTDCLDRVVSAKMVWQDAWKDCLQAASRAKS